MSHNLTLRCTCLAISGEARVLQLDMVYRKLYSNRSLTTPSNLTIKSAATTLFPIKNAISKHALRPAPVPTETHIPRPPASTSTQDPNDGLSRDPRSHHCPSRGPRHRDGARRADDREVRMPVGRVLEGRTGVHSGARRRWQRETVKGPQSMEEASLADGRHPYVAITGACPLVLL